MYAKSLLPVMNALGIATPILDAFFTTPLFPLLTNASIGLYTAAATPPNPGSVLSDFTSALFTGYAPATITAGIGPVNLQGNNGLGMIGNNSWLCTAAPVTPEIELGYYVWNPASGLVYYAEAFPSPIPIQFAGDYIDLDWILPMVFLQRTGQ